MLKEFPNLRQYEDGFRRLFLDEFFELYLWYEAKDGELTGFQLNYSVRDDPHALTCSIDCSCTHARIDEGEDAPGSYKSTPILVGDGNFDKDTVLERFRTASHALEPKIRNLVLKAVQGYR